MQHLPKPARSNNALLESVAGEVRAREPYAIYRMDRPLNWRRKEGLRFCGDHTVFEFDLKEPGGPLIDMTDCRDCVVESLAVRVVGAPPDAGIVLARSIPTMGANWNALKRVSVYGKVQRYGFAVVGAEFSSLHDCNAKVEGDGVRGLAVLHESPGIKSPYGPIADPAPQGVSQWLFTSDNSSYTVTGANSVGVELGRGVGGVRIWGNVSVNGGRCAYLISGSGGSTGVHKTAIEGLAEGRPADGAFGIEIAGPTFGPIDISLLHVNAKYTGGRVTARNPAWMSGVKE